MTEQINLTPAQIGILKDIRELRVDLDNISDWMREQLAQIIFQPTALLIDTQGPSVFLTAAGEAYLQTVLRDHRTPRAPSEASSETSAQPQSNRRSGENK